MIKIFFLFIFPIIGYSHIISKSETGNNIKWDNAGRSIIFEYNPEPVFTNITLDVTEQQISAANMTVSEYIENRTEEILLDSITQWNSVGTFKLVLTKSSSLPSVNSGSNTFRFSTDRRFFGAGVIGVTTIGFSTDGGDIISADILLNQNNLATTLTLDPRKSSDTEAYIGDIISHELGHFFGLSHTQLVGSTMVFSIFKGQHSLSEDDIAGVQRNYGVIEQDTGILTGTVVADKNAQSVFGVSVDLVSVNKNQVVQNQITDEDGTFTFYNVDNDDFYYFRISPIKNKSTIPNYYETANNKLCGNNDYRGSFYTECGSWSKSRPQVFGLKGSTETLDVGNITVRCDENISPYYFRNKLSGAESFEIVTNPHGPNIFNGFFTSNELVDGLLGTGDSFTIDLTSIDVSGSEVARLGLMSTGFGSNYDILAFIRRDTETSWTTYQSTTDADGKLVPDRFIDLSLSSNASENYFHVKLFPIKLLESQQYEIFSVLASNSKNLNNKNNLYTLSVNVGSGVGNSYISSATMDSYPYSDNLSCLEGKVNIPAKPYISSSLINDAAQSTDENEFGVGCGTIDIDNNNPSGPFSFFVGILSFALLLFQQRLGYKVLSKY